MDDESYFTFSGSNMPGNVGYYAEAGGDVPAHVKYRCESKFPKKLMVWAAISPRGVSEPVIMASRESVGGVVYREKCLRKGLIPFLNEKYPDRDMVFWPDLASAHYARETLDLLREERVPVVQREENPPCTPQIRPIEDLSGIIKQKVYRGGWEAKTEAQLKRRIRQVIRNIDPEVPRNMMKSLPERTRMAERMGVESQIH